MNEHWYNIQPFKKTMDKFVSTYSQLNNVLVLVPVHISQATIVPKELTDVSSHIDTLRQDFVELSRKLISDENEVGSIANVLRVINDQDLQANDPSDLKGKFATEISSLKDILNTFIEEYDGLDRENDDKMTAFDYIRDNFALIVKVSVAYSNYISLLQEIHERETGRGNGDNSDVESDEELGGGGGKKRRRRLKKSKRGKKSKQHKKSKKSKKHKKSNKGKKTRKTKKK